MSYADFFRTATGTDNPPCDYQSRLAGNDSGTLRLGQHNEPGLCGRDLVEAFTFVRSPDGLVLSMKIAKQMGQMDPDVTVEDLLSPSDPE